MMLHSRCFSFPVTEHWFKVLFYSLCSIQSHMLRPRAQSENWLCSQLSKVFTIVTLKCFHSAAVEWPISLTNRMKAKRFTEAKRLKPRPANYKLSSWNVQKCFIAWLFRIICSRQTSAAAMSILHICSSWLKISTHNLREAQSKQGKPV